MNSKEYRKKYYDENKEKLKAYQKWYYIKNKDRKKQKKLEPKPPIEIDQETKGYLMRYYGTFILTFD